MSADNTIVVLRTPVHAEHEHAPPEYRVAELQAAENLTYPETAPAHRQRLILSTFGTSPVYKREEEAWRRAIAMADRKQAVGHVLVHGVRSVSLTEPFPGS